MKKEIVFGPSVQGSLRMAQITGVGEFPKSMICTIKDDSGKVPDRIKRLNKENEEKWYNSRPIGGNAKDIICLELSLEYGDISGRIPGKKRDQVIYQLISTMYPESRNGNIAKEWVDGIAGNNRKYLKLLKDAISNEEEIRIWYSNSPSEINGFYWLMNYLDKNKYYEKVSAVYLPPNYWTGKYYCNAWGQMPPEKWFDTLSLEKNITKEQIKHCSEKWKDLQKDNLPLRLMVSGSIVSLHEEFLDSIIRDVIKNMSKTFKISRLVGEVMGKTELMLGDLIIFERVNSMIERGEILLAEEWQESAMRTLVKNNR
ncbi:MULTISPECIES: DUF3658 domain-containing protein [unclassified Butyrivibrio]|uniref:DUF3658 domain-containing protein n=1 Tax=unclassified Butyrivibrio TaxID=2639466 RepID=UPI0003F55687|nr:MULTISPECIES: DUF3658 domain-containing protein [unclassified Butyrivibrio]